MKTLLIVFLLALFFISPLASAAQTTVTVQPSSKVLVVGDIITVYINVTPGQSIDTVAIDLLEWNPHVINCTGITRGAIFDNPLVWLAGHINNTAGNITLSVAASTTSTTTPGTYSIITFKARAPGITTIAIQKFGVAKNGSDLPKQILNNCQITVEGSTVQPPVDPPPSNTSNTTHTNQTTNQTTNNTTPPTNGTTNTTDNTNWFDTNNTYVPIDDTTQQNDTIPPTTDDSKPFDIVAELQKIPILIYALILIIVISTVAYITVRHIKNKREDEDENEDDFFGGVDDDEADSGSEL